MKSSALTFIFCATFTCWFTNSTLPLFDVKFKLFTSIVPATLFAPSWCDVVLLVLKFTPIDTSTRSVGFLFPAIVSLIIELSLAISLISWNPLNKVLIDWSCLSNP